MSCNNKKPDFLAADFLAADFDTTWGVVEFPIKFSTLLFEKLPYYYKDQDTYKNGAGQGLLERYLGIFGAFLDTKVIPDIECYLSILDASICDSKYLAHLGNSMGNPPDIFKTDTGYRSLLQYVVSVYKIKGTKEAYELFFSILGYDTILTEIPPAVFLDTAVDQNENRYDSSPDLIYDAESPFIYDYSQSENCTQYDLELTPKIGTSIQTDESLIRRINETIIFNEPINAILRKLTIHQ